MFLSIFTDELGCDLAEALPIAKSWGLAYVNLRGRIFGKSLEDLSAEEMHQVKRLLDENGLKVGCLQSSLAKVHLPDAQRQQQEMRKLEAIIGAAELFGCRLVRSFFYWQPPSVLAGKLAADKPHLQRALEMFSPLAQQAKKAGLILGFENCGVTEEEVAAFLEALGHKSWGLAWDVSNGWFDSASRKQDEKAWIARCAKLTRLVHVKGAGRSPNWARCCRGSAFSRISTTSASWAR